MKQLVKLLKEFDKLCLMVEGYLGNLINLSERFELFQNDDDDNDNLLFQCFGDISLLTKNKMLKQHHNIILNLQGIMDVDLEMVLKKLLNLQDDIEEMNISSTNWHEMVIIPIQDEESIQVTYRYLIELIIKMYIKEYYRKDYIIRNLIETKNDVIFKPNSFYVEKLNEFKTETLIDLQIQNKFYQYNAKT